MLHRPLALASFIVVVASAGAAGAETPAEPAPAAPHVVTLAGPAGEILIGSDPTSRWARVAWPGLCGPADPRALRVTTTSTTGKSFTRALPVEAIAPLATPVGRAACGGWIHMSTDGLAADDKPQLALDERALPASDALALVTMARPTLMPVDVSGKSGDLAWRVLTWPRGMLRSHQLQLLLTPRRDPGAVKAITLAAGDLEAVARTSGARPTKAAILDEITARRLATASKLVVRFDGGKPITLKPNPLAAGLAAHDAAAAAMVAPPTDLPPATSPWDADVTTVAVPVFDDGRR